MRIATLNVQNLRLRKVDGEDQLHGAWDGDDPEDESLDPIDRRLTADLVAGANADVIALQEVFDLETLDYFHDMYLRQTGVLPYPHRVCLPGNDGRGFNVALMSRREISALQSHANLMPEDLNEELPRDARLDQPIFRRDCVLATIGGLVCAVCHFKSPYPDPLKAWTARRLEALATRHIIERTFADHADSLWLILGDLNEPARQAAGRGPAIAPLTTDFAVDLMQRVPEAERWTYFDAHSGRYACPDAMLASPDLARRYPLARPFILRKGLGREARRFGGSRLTRVGEHRPHASDHAAVAIDLPGL